MYKSSKAYGTEYASDGRRRISKWPFAVMEIGDEITVEDCANHDNASCSYKYSAKKYKMKFSRKTVNGVLHIERIS